MKFLAHYAKHVYLSSITKNLILEKVSCEVLEAKVINIWIVSNPNRLTEYLGFFNYFYQSQSLTVMAYKILIYLNYVICNYLSYSMLEHKKDRFQNNKIQKFLGSLEL